MKTVSLFLTALVCGAASSSALAQNDNQETILERQIGAATHATLSTVGVTDTLFGITREQPPNHRCQINPQELYALIKGNTVPLEDIKPPYGWPYMVHLARAGAAVQIIYFGYDDSLRPLVFDGQTFFRINQNLTSFWIRMTARPPHYPCDVMPKNPKSMWANPG